MAGSLRHALTPHADALREQLHGLLATFMASRSIADRLVQESPATIEMLAIKPAERASIAKLLLAISVGLRVLDDQARVSQDLFVGDCGTLLSDAASPQDSTGLSLRDACNKVIHAEDVDLIETPLTPQVSYLEPYIHLTGRSQNGSKQWKATLSIYEFARAGLCTVSRCATPEV